ncbi:MAG: hypothetical protein ISR64_00090 [Deltaproteobacteria bacterium]|nr:hypothetical protein [Deltaproteobacteria bacterium]
MAATFDGSTMTMTLNSQTIIQEVTVPMTCGTELEAQCADLTDDLTCAVGGDNCICTKTQTNPGEEPTVQEYTVDGNEIVIPEESGDTREPYCVQGDMVISLNENMFGEGTGKIYMFLTKM